MFGLSIFKKNATEKFKAVITADAFGGIFEYFSSKKNPLSLVPVYASIKIISQTIAIADLNVYKKTAKGRELQTDHPMAKLFKSPFGDMTYFNWMQMMALNLSGYGNAYALIIRDINYNIKELVPLEYDMVFVMKDTTSNSYYYQVTHNAKSFNVFPEQMVHYRVFSKDGLRGLSPIELHRATTDSLSSESDYLASFYEKAANLSGTIESESATQKQIDSIKDKFEAKYGGAGMSGKTLILPGGMSYKQLKLLSPMDANYIETAKLNRSDVAVIFGIPPSLLGDLSQATYSNLSELNRAFYKMTIAPYFKAISQENDMKLLKESEKPTIYTEFDPDILLAMTKKERYETYAIGIRNGIVSRNEVREFENLEKLDGLDEILQESGVMTISQADENFKNSEVQQDETELLPNTKDTIETTDDETSSLTKDIKSLKLAIKNSGIKNQSDVLSHLGRIAGLVETSVKTSNKDN